MGGTAVLHLLFVIYLIFFLLVALFESRGKK